MHAPPTKHKRHRTGAAETLGPGNPPSARTLRTAQRITRIHKHMAFAMRTHSQNGQVMGRIINAITVDLPTGEHRFLVYGDAPDRPTHVEASKGMKFVSGWDIIPTDDGWDVIHYDSMKCQSVTDPIDATIGEYCRAARRHAERMTMGTRTVNDIVVNWTASTIQAIGPDGNTIIQAEYGQDYIQDQHTGAAHFTRTPIDRFCEIVGSGECTVPNDYPRCHVCEALSVYDTCSTDCTMALIDTDDTYGERDEQERRSRTGSLRE